MAFAGNKDLKNRYLDLDSGRLVYVYDKNRDDGRWQGVDLHSHKTRIVYPNRLDPLVSELGEIRVGMRISYDNNPFALEEFGTIEAISERGFVAVRVHYFGEQEHGETTIFRRIGEIHKEVFELPSFPFKKGQVVCARDTVKPKVTKGQDVEIQALFENQTAEITVGDFFGKRFGIFIRRELVPVKLLGPCAND